MQVSFNQSKQYNPKFTANVFWSDAIRDAVVCCKNPITKLKIAKANKRFEKCNPEGNIDLRLHTFSNWRTDDYLAAGEIPRVTEDARRPGSFGYSSKDCISFFKKQFDGSNAELRRFYVEASKKYEQLIEFRNKQGTL